MVLLTGKLSVKFVRILDLLTNIKLNNLNKLKNNLKNVTLKAIRVMSWSLFQKKNKKTKEIIKNEGLSSTPRKMIKNYGLYEQDHMKYISFKFKKESLNSVLLLLTNDISSRQVPLSDEPLQLLKQKYSESE